MNDCKLIVTVKDGNTHFAGADLGMVELAGISGYLQTFVAMEALRYGMDLDEVKNKMWDLYAVAMETAEELWRKGGPDGGEKEDD